MLAVICVKLSGMFVRLQIEISIPYPASIYLLVISQKLGCIFFQIFVQIVAERANN
jgi:hypothetical protein